MCGLSKIIPLYIAIVSVYGIITGFSISLSDEIFDLEKVLKSNGDFIRCIFMWQFAAYILLDDLINKAGIIIVEVIITFVALPMNIMIFAILVICLAIKGICVCFYKVFRKRNEESEVSE